MYAQEGQTEQGAYLCVLVRYSPGVTEAGGKLGHDSRPAAEVICQHTWINRLE